MFATSISLVTEICAIRFKAWDKPDFHRSAEDIAFAVAMFFQKRGSVQNYYMV
jgi:hypothetical protein